MPHKALLTLTVIFLTLNYAHASDPAVRAVYGDGVHSFYSGDFQQSHNYLSQVVDLGTDDPRVYYFRGLSALQLGKRNAADADFKKENTSELSLFASAKSLSLPTLAWIRWSQCTVEGTAASERPVNAN